MTGNALAVRIVAFASGPSKDWLAGHVLPLLREGKVDEAKRRLRIALSQVQGHLSKRMERG